MAKVRNEVGQKVRDTIDRVLREKLGPHGYREATVRAGPDHDGDPVLFVVAHFDLVPEPFDPALTFDNIDAVRDALDEVDEFRFPHIRYDFHDDQTLVERKKRRKRA